MGTDICKIEEEMIEKMKPKEGNPLKKWVEFTAHNMYSFIIKHIRTWDKDTKLLFFNLLV